MCLAKTGANPVRPHMIAINARQTHAIVSFVATGHVLIIDAAARTPVDCIRTSVGAGGARQVHFAIPSPDETYLAVANQNGKLFERIDTDYATNTYTLNTAAGIDLANCTTPNGVPCQDADPARQRADLSDHRVHQSLCLRHAARRRAVRRRCEADADADRRRVRHRHRAPQRLPWRAGRRQDVRRLGRRHARRTSTVPTSMRSRSAASRRQSAQHSGAACRPERRMPRPTHTARRSPSTSATSGWPTAAATSSGSSTRRPTRSSTRSRSPEPSATTRRPTCWPRRPTAATSSMSLRGPNPLTADPHVSTGSTPGVGVIKVLQGGRSGTSRVSRGPAISTPASSVPMSTRYLSA